MTFVTWSVGCFGKLPFHGEFLRLGGDASPVEPIERWWLAGALDPQRGAQRMGGFTTSGPLFALFPHQGTWWAVALFPSQDQVGRQYPFAVFAGLPAESIGEDAGLAPALFVPFFHSVYQASAAGWASSLPELREQLAGLGGAVDVGAQERRLLADLAGATAHDLWSGLIGSFADRRRYRIVDALQRACADRESIGLRIAPMPHQVHCCFWLMLLRLLRPGARGLPLVVLHPGLAGRLPAATAFWTMPTPARAFATLWPACGLPPAANPAEPDVVDLLAAALTQTSAGGDVGLRELLDDPDLTLRNLLHDLTARARQAGRAR